MAPPSNPAGPFDLDFRGVHEAPGQVVGRQTRRRLGPADREGRLVAVERRGRIGQSGARDPLGVVEDELFERRPDDGGPVRVLRNRQDRHDVSFGGSDVPLPPDLHQGEPQREERRLDRDTSPVGDCMVDGPVPSGHVDRPVDLDGRAVLDTAGPVGPRLPEIHDVTVPGIVRVDVAIGDAPHSLVLSYAAEALPIERGRLHDLEVDPGDLGESVPSK